MDYHFDEPVNHRGIYSIKYEAPWRADEMNEDTIPLFVADMDFKTAPPILDALHRTVDFGLFGYTAAAVVPDYAEAVCHWWKTQYGCSFPPEAVVYSNGTVEALNNAVRTFTNVGDGVIIQRPVYGHFTSALEQQCHRRVVSSRLIRSADGRYTIDFEDLEQKCADPTNRAMIFCSPANPVGRVWSREEIRRVCEITARYNVLLISDEVHCDIRRRGVRHYPVLTVAEDLRNIIMLTGINKSFNLAGLQCSNAIIPDPFLRARFVQAFGEREPTQFAISALIAAYRECEDWLAQLNDYLDGNIDFVLGFLQENMPWVKTARPEGTYCMWLDFSACGLPDEEIHRRIYRDANVILQDGLVHDPEGGACFQRICVPCPRPVLRRAMERIAAQFTDIR